MDTLANYRKIIKEVLTPYTTIPYSHGELTCQAIFDEKSDSYLLVTLGWDKAKRIHGCLVHLDIINGKVWVQRDETEDGVTKELVAAGIAKEAIVLGFHPADVRPYTGYAVV